MGEPVVLTAVDPARGWRTGRSRRLDEDAVDFELVHGKRSYHVVVQRAKGGGAPTSVCSCSARPPCAHERFVVDALRASHSGKSWLAGKPLANAPEPAPAAVPARAPGREAGPPPKAAPRRAASPAHGGSTRRSRAPNAAAEDALDAHERGRIEAWLNELAGAERVAAAPAKAPAAPRTAIYFLAPQHDGSVEVTVWAASPKRDGSLGRTKQIDLTKAIRGTSKLTPADLGFVAALRGHSANGWQNSVTLAGDATDLLLALVDTTRCFIPSGTEDARLVARGEERAGVLGWRTTEHGVQIPHVTVAGGGMALAFDPPLYLDTASGAVGRLTFGQPFPLVRAFLEGPGLRPESSQAARHAAREHLGRFGLPEPRALRVEHGPAPAPRPRLVLYSMKVNPGFLLDALVIDGAHLEFDYGPTRFPAASDLTTYREVAGDVVRVRERRFDLEQEQARRLADLGFEPILRHTLQRHVPEVRRALSAMGRTTEDLTFPVADGRSPEERWLDFLGPPRRELTNAGWHVELDPSFRHNLAEVQSFFAAANGLPDGAWFELDVGIVVGGERFDLLPVLLDILAQGPQGELPAKLVNSTSPTLRVSLADGRTVALPTARIRSILVALLEMQAGAKLDGGKLRLPRLLAARVLALEEHVEKVEWRGKGNAELRELAQRLAGFTSVQAVAAPDGLRTDLRPYQREGLAWLQFLREHGLGGILADDMGLGKTVQAIAHVLAEKAAGRLDRPCLVVSPTSVVNNWASEVARFAPELSVLVLHGKDRGQSFGKVAETDVVLTTYPLIVRDIDSLRTCSFHLVVLDEAQAIKNAGAKVARALRTLESRHRLCLTGTPLENNLAELWAQFDFLVPGLLGDARAFGRVFRGPVEKAGDAQRREALKARIRPFLLRRTKTLVAGELPPKTEVLRRIELQDAQRDLYETIRLAVHDRVRQAIADKGLEQAQIVILDALLKLRQVCCDPRLVKLDAARKVQASAKLEALLELLPALIEDGRKILLFSQFTSMLALIEPELRKRGIGYVQIVGDTKDRKTPVERFQAGEVPLFLISLKAGGTGLNLTAADTVIHYDPWWNPAVEQQATDRAHRLGQDKPVFVYKLLAAGTVEERIGRLQERKRALASGLLDGGERQGAALTTDDVQALFAALDEGA